MTPNASLEVQSNATDYTSIRLRNTQSADGIYELRSIQTGGPNNGFGIWGGQEGFEAYRFVITKDGKVGIGFLDPQTKLSVNGTISAKAFSSLRPLIFEAPAGVERMRIDDVTGNILVAGVPIINAAGKWIGAPSGIQGPKGADGVAGPAGPAGAKGATGDAGPTGPAGVKGADGVAGPTGPAGPAGTSGGGGRGLPPGGFTIPPCPTGFASIAAANNELGCMQTRREGPPAPAPGPVGIQLPPPPPSRESWMNASQTCFTKFGGRLPSTGEWVIAASNVRFFDIDITGEWNNDFSRGGHSVVGSARPNPLGIKFDFNVAPDLTLLPFRCWIPR